MHKVTTINLNGRAYQLEDQGYGALQTYLHHAGQALANDPDKAEVLADIEQAIADKCERMLKAGKNVVTAKQIDSILDEMGEVEGNDESNGKAADETASGPAAPKRLFVIREGAMLMGVCRGLGAYFGVDPTFVRIGFVVLTFVTSGFGILIYLLLGLLLPTAKTEADLSEAYGKPITAQAIAERARERAPSPEALQNFSEVLVKILRVVAKVARVVFAIGLGFVTAVWLMALWSLIFGHLQFYDQLQVLNGWRTFLIITTIYLIVAVPVFVISRVSDRIAENREQSRATTATEGSLSALWGIACVVLVVLGISYAQNFQDYVSTHQGHIDVGTSHICVDDNLCNPDGSQFQYRQ
jgi:phage shock protein PspC (stress-responsive transcriptional regulator)